MLNIFIKKLIFKLFCIYTDFIIFFSKSKIEDLEYYKRFFKFLSLFKSKYYYNIGNNKVHYNPLLSGIGYRIFFDGSFESKELSICSKYFKTDSIVFDIGANIGTHSIFFSKIVKTGHIFSFEPSRFTFEYLLKNVQQISNITPLNLGISNLNSVVDFYESEDNALSGLKDTKRSRIKNISKIVCFSVDSFCEKLFLEKLDFVKIDVEGFEQQVIEGMINTIQKFKPVIFCEIFKGVNSNLNPLNTIETIKNLNYIVYVIKESELQKFEFHDDNYCNYLFIPKNNQL